MKLFHPVTEMVHLLSHMYMYSNHTSIKMLELYRLETVGHKPVAVLPKAYKPLVNHIAMIYRKANI